MSPTRKVNPVELEACMLCGAVFKRKYTGGTCPSCGGDITE